MIIRRGQNDIYILRDKKKIYVYGYSRLSRIYFYDDQIDKTIHLTRERERGKGCVENDKNA